MPEHHLPVSPPGPVLRVLVVDDNHDAADSLALLAALWGHQVLTVYGAGAALQAAPAFRPHLMLIDLAMPRMDGTRLARQLRQQPGFSQTVLVAVTGYGDDAHRQLADESGFDHFLVKPVEPDTLENLLGVTLQAVRLARQGRECPAEEAPLAS